IWYGLQIRRRGHAEPVLRATTAAHPAPAVPLEVQSAEAGGDLATRAAFRRYGRASPTVSDARISDGASNSLPDRDAGDSSTRTTARHSSFWYCRSCTAADPTKASPGDLESPSGGTL